MPATFIDPLPPTVTLSRAEYDAILRDIDILFDVDTLLRRIESELHSETPDIEQIKMELHHFFVARMKSRAD